MNKRAAMLATVVVMLLAGCTGPIAIPLPTVVDSLIPGRSLAQTVADGIPPADQGLTVTRLTAEPETAPLQAEPGNLWPDPVPPVPTLGQVADQVRTQEQNGNAPPATVTVQPRTPTP